MGALAEALGRFLAPILEPIFMACLAKYFGNTAEVAKPNAELQDEASKAFGGAHINIAVFKLRNEGDNPQTGNGSDTSGAN